MDTTCYTLTQIACTTFRQTQTPDTVTHRLRDSVPGIRGQSQSRQREERGQSDLDAEAISESDLSNQTKIGIRKYLSPMSHMFPTSSIEFVYIRSMYRIVVRERRLYNTQNFIMVSLRGRK